MGLVILQTQICLNLKKALPTVESQGLVGLLSCYFSHFKISLHENDSLGNTKCQNQIPTSKDGLICIHRGLIPEY